MSELALTTQTTDRPLSDEPRYKVDTVPAKNGRPLRITRKVRAAIDAMVWQGLKRDEAAQAAGLKDNSMYVALARPDVKAYYLSQCEVLRVSGRARRIQRLEQMVEQDENKMAVVQAVKALDAIPDNEVSAGTQSRSPGVVIIVQNGVAQPTQAPNAVQVIDNAESEER